MIRRIFELLWHFVYAVVWGSILAILSRLPPPPPPKEVKKRTRIDRLLEAGVLFGILGLIGFLVVLSGMIPIKASSGHWPITRWFLEFSMERAFTMQSLRIKTPPLDDQRLVLLGATQYETTCRPCHGAPDLRSPRVAAAMTPTPPYLRTEITKWKPAEIFSIVKHGVKFTGMPGWPAANRDDEVWAMVAFLQRLPTLDAAEYHRLAFGETRATGASAPIEMLTGPENLPRAVQERCARCHGVDGRGRGTGAFPKLAGQHAPYLYLALRSYEKGRRHSGIMEPIAAGLSQSEMRELATYYSQLEPAVGKHMKSDGHSHDHRSTSPMNAAEQAARAERTTTPALLRGREIVERGVPSQRIPPCADCHGPTQPHPRHEYPMLAGQYADYIVLQLELFRNGHRGGSPYAHLMQEVAPKLTQQQMRDVAVYYESLR